MAKDPAVLFYTSDFLAGTSFFSYEEMGQYISLLCKQHQLGEIPENHMISVCGSLDSIVVSKFVKDRRGFYYNERMRIEGERRRNYCDSRSNNKSGRKPAEKDKIIRKSYDKRMEDVNENENVNIKAKRFIRPKLSQVIAYCKETKSSIDPELFFNNYESTDWVKANGQPVKNWKATIKTWEKRGFAVPGQKQEVPNNRAKEEYKHFDE